MKKPGPIYGRTYGLLLAFALLFVSPSAPAATTTPTSPTCWTSSVSAAAPSLAAAYGTRRFGQVPVIQDGDFTLADSNAILVYLATKYSDGSWLPREPEAAAAVQRFLSVATGEISAGPAKARVINLFKLDTDPAPAKAIASNLFKLLDAHLAAQPFLAGERPTIADVACYTYIAHAPEGGIVANAGKNRLLGRCCASALDLNIGCG